MRKNKTRTSFYIGVCLAIAIFSCSLTVFMFSPLFVHSTLADSSSESTTSEDTKCNTGEIELNVWMGTWCVKNIVDYILIFYKYFISVIGIFAVAMIMFGGFKWITSSGSPEKVSQAKDSITSAIIGVVLALISYVLLYLINPMITEMHFTEPETIGQINLDITYCSQIGNDSMGNSWQKQVGLNEGENLPCTKSKTILDLSVSPPEETNRICYGDYCGNNQVCHYDGIQFSCGSLQETCEDTPNDQCDIADATIARETDGKMGCRKADIGPGVSDKCRLGNIINVNDINDPSSPDPRYEKVDCNTVAAQDTCYYRDGNSAKPLRCDMYGDWLTRRLWCTNTDRPVQGVNTVCVHDTQEDKYYLYMGKMGQALGFCPKENIVQ